MPYKAKGKCVYKADSGKKVGCTKGPVKKYLAALHANVPDAKNEELNMKNEPIKLSEMAKKLMENYDQDDWRTDPYWSREFEKSDVSQDEFERHHRLGQYARGRGGYSGGYGGGGYNRPHIKGITFFNVPADKENVAINLGLKKTKSGKWGIQQLHGRDYVEMLKAAEKEFGPGRFWAPKN